MYVSQTLEGKLIDCGGDLELLQSLQSKPETDDDLPVPASLENQFFFRLLLKNPKAILDSVPHDQVRDPDYKPLSHNDVSIQPLLPIDVDAVSKTVYLTSSFSLVSNLTLHVPPGVVLRGTETDADNMLSSQLWPTLPWLEHPSMPCNDCPYTCGAGCGPTKRAWLYGQNVSGVRISGGGTLHGGGEHGRLYSVVFR